MIYTRNSSKVVVAFRNPRVEMYGAYLGVIHLLSRSRRSGNLPAVRARGYIRLSAK